MQTAKGTVWSCTFGPNLYLFTGYRTNGLHVVSDFNSVQVHNDNNSDGPVAGSRFPQSEWPGDG